MALQGTIETFALPDVLRLLATTKKSGRLRLSGSRGSGSVWLDGGQIVASEATGAPHADGPSDVVFELLRYAEGSFAFDETEQAAAPDAPSEVEEVLGAAEAQLEEWVAIEAVVPSLDAWASLAVDAPEDEFTLSRDEWTLLVTIGSGATVGDLGDRLEQAELAISRAVKELIERSLVDLGEAPEGAPAAPSRAVAAEPPVPEVELEPIVEPEPEPAPVFEPSAEAVEEFEPIIEFDEPEADRPSLEVVPTFDEEPAPFDPGGLVIEDTGPEPEPTFDEPAAEPEPVAEGPEPDAAEIARQLANLSPKAAKAVAAAAKATTEEERMAALADVDESEDGLNRDLLLKFLGTMNP